MRKLLVALLLTALTSLSVPTWALQLDSAMADSPRADSLTTDSTATDTVVASSPEPPMVELVSHTVAAAALIGVAEAAPAETSAVEEPPATAPLFIGGRQVLQFRVARDGLLPVERAAAARKRITRAGADKSIPVDSLKLNSGVAGVEFQLGPHFLFLVRPGDADINDSRELTTWLAQLADDVRTGIDSERTGRTPIRLLISAGIALLLTLVALLVARVLGSLGTRWREWLHRNVRPKIPALRVANFEVLSNWQLAGFVESMLGRLDMVVALSLLYWYLAAVFSLFPWTQGWAWILLHFATSNVFDILSGFASALPGLFVIVLIFFLFRWLVGLADRFFVAVDEGQIALPWLHPELVRPSRRLFRILLWIVAFMVAYPYLPGSQSRAVQGVSIFIGIIISLGSTAIVGNILAGFVLTYSRSFRVGDRVRIGSETGDIVSLGFFSTKLRSIRNEEITIPNGLVANGAIVNYSRLAKGEGLVLHTEVTIGYDVEWRKVHELLIKAAKSVEGIEEDPEPWVFQKALNDYHVAYELNAATKEADRQAKLYSDLHAAIQDAFAEAGVEILSPGYHAIRDANANVLPAAPSGPRPRPSAFRIRRTDDSEGS